MPPRQDGKTRRKKSDEKEEDAHRYDSYQELKIDYDNLTSILDKFPEFMYVSDPDTYEVLYVNKKLRSLIKGDVEGMKCHEVFQGLASPCEFCTNHIITKTNMPHVWDHYNQNLKRHFLSTDQLITWHDGRKVRFETAIDITDQKKIEMLLKASEKKYRSFIEQSTYGFFITDRNSNIIYLNDVAKEMYGYKGNGDIRIKLSEVILPEDLDMALKNTRAIASGEDVARPGTYRIRCLDGEIRTVELQSFPIWRDENLEGFHGTVLDITDRLNADKQLLEKSEFLDAVINNTSDGIFVLDEDFRYVLINPASGRIMGHDPKEWIGKEAGSNKHPDDVNIALESVMKVMNGEPANCEIRVKASDGTYHLLDIRYNPMMLNDKFHILGMVTDITEKKKAEEALKENEERYRSLYDHAIEGIILMPVDHETLIVNRSFARMHGYDSPKDMEHLRLDDLDTPETAKLAPERLRRLISGEPMSFEVEHYHKDGHSIPLLVSCKVFDVGGKPHYMGFHQDMTTKKKAEEALKVSEERYRNLFELSPEPIILLDRKGKIMECNQATERLFFLDKQDMLKKRLD
ncbi:MAG: PAS domain S-box protein, partial [Thermoplasmata archaeon]